MVPNCRAYDPAFAGELAMILDQGMRQMLERQEDVFYYITLMNENHTQPALAPDAHADLIKGLYRFGERTAAVPWARIRLLGSGAILQEVIAAAGLLAADWGIGAEIWSANSYSELARDARETERWNRLHPDRPPRRSHAAACLDGDTTIVVASDYVRAWPQLIASYVDTRFVVLGTDGFGRSALRSFFEVDRHHVVLAALHALAQDGRVDVELCRQAIARYRICTDIEAPWLR